jgi:hypothetical protein
LHDPIISITTIIAITIIIYFRKRERKGNWSLDAARNAGGVSWERTGNRAERSKRRRFAWEEKPKTENENEDEDDYDWGTKTRIDKSATTKSAIARSPLLPRPLSGIGIVLGLSPMLVKSSLK